MPIYFQKESEKIVDTFYRAYSIRSIAIANRAIMSAFTMNNHSAIEIANIYLSKENHGIDNLKINKLVYITLGYSLAFLKKDIFYEAIEAWKYGPVIPNLYHTYKTYGAKAIDQFTGETIELENDVEDVIGKVWNTYVSERGVDLINLTHEPNTPWSLYYEPDKNNVIERDVIRKYYSLILDV